MASAATDHAAVMDHQSEQGSPTELPQDAAQHDPSVSGETEQCVDLEHRHDDRSIGVVAVDRHRDAMARRVERARQDRQLAEQLKKQANDVLRDAIRVEQEAILELEQLTETTKSAPSAGSEEQQVDQVDPTYKLTQPKEQTDDTAGATSAGDDIAVTAPAPQTVIQEDLPKQLTSTVSNVEDATTSIAPQPPIVEPPVKRKRWKKVAQRRNASEQDSSASDDDSDTSPHGRRTKRARIPTNKGKDFFRGMQQRQVSRNHRAFHYTNLPWTDEEEVLLAKGHNECGHQLHKWDDISAIVATRSAKQCKGHWLTRGMQRRLATLSARPVTKSFPPNSHALVTKRARIPTNKGNDFFQGMQQGHVSRNHRAFHYINRPWTDEEEVLLATGHNEYGHQLHKWDDISAIVATRSAKQCKDHWITRGMQRRFGNTATLRARPVTKSYPPNSHALVHNNPVLSNNTTATPAPRPRGIYRTGIIRALEDTTSHEGVLSMVAIRKHMLANMDPTKKWINYTYLSVLKTMVAAGELLCSGSAVTSRYKLSRELMAKRSKERLKPAVRTSSSTNRTTPLLLSKRKTTPSTAKTASAAAASSTATDSYVDPRKNEGIWSFDNRNTHVSSDISRAQSAALLEVLKKEQHQDDDISIECKEAIILAFDAHRRLDFGWVELWQISKYVQSKLGRNAEWAGEVIPKAFKAMTKAGNITGTTMKTRYGQYRLTAEFKRKRSTAFAEALHKIRAAQQQEEGKTTTEQPPEPLTSQSSKPVEEKRSAPGCLVLELEESCMWMNEI